MNLLKKWFKILEYKKIYDARTIAQLIGEYYFGKYKHLTIKERYKQTREDITNLGITEIKITGNTLSITLERIGLLIGRRGENIDNLRKYLELNSKIKNIKLKEDKIISWLIPYHYLDEYEPDYIEDRDNA